VEPASARCRLSIVKAGLVALVAMLGSLTACSSTAHKAGQRTTTDRSSVVSSPVSSSPPASTIPDSAFRVAAPILDAAAGPGPALDQTPCVPSDVTATAQTRPIVAGVAGVVELIGAHCSLHISAGPSELLDSAGNKLAVPVDTGVTSVNPAANQRPDLPLGVGILGWGFTWRGSWCGPAATAVVIALDDVSSHPARSAGEQIVAPLTGPAPSCQGISDAVLVPGVPGEPTDPTLTPPPQWAGLQATLTLPATTDGHTLPSVVVELRNTTAVPITISPCPDYSLDIDSTVPNGTEMDAGGGVLPCTQSAQVIPAHGAISYHLGAQPYDQGGLGNGANQGSVVTARFAIAGIPTASGTTRVN
jgi:hypothetical protein